MNFLKNFLIENNYKKFNYKNFDNNNYKNGSKILIEFNAFHPTHLCFSYVSNFLAKKYKSEIIAYNNYAIISSPLISNLKNKIKWCIGKFFGLKSFGIYKSFGTKEIIKPDIEKSIIKKNENTAKKILKKITNKEKLLKVKFDNIEVGDFIYDTYLKKFNEPSVNINSENFKKLFLDFYKLYFFWKTYFDKNKVKAVIGVHSCYSYGLILRIAYKKSIPTFAVSYRWIFRLSKKMKYINGQFINYRKTFKKLNQNLRTNGKNEANKKLRLRFRGKGWANVELITSQNSSFKKKRFKPLIKKSKRIKILIAPHDFFDAVHIYGNMFFNDFYEWLNFLGKISENTEYDWYIKNRPNHPGKFKIYQPYTQKIIEDFSKKFKNIKLLPNEYSHHQIIHEGIDFVLTCYGSVGIEYAYYKIPVINASKNNPHNNYDFNINPKNKKEYIFLLKNLKKYINFGKKISKEQIKEYYFMRHIFLDKNWMFRDLNKMIKFVGSYDKIWSHKLYEYWMKNYDMKKKEKINSQIKNFFNSNDSHISINHRTNRI